MDLATVDNLLDGLELRARSVLRRAGVADDDARIHRLLECRYVGQAYEVQVPLPEGSVAQAGRASLAARFEQRYRELYGRTLPGGAIELLTWRVQARGSSPAAAFQFARERAIGEPLRGERNAYFPGQGFVRCMVLDRYALRSGDRYEGPVLVEEDETTTVVGPGARLDVDGDLNLVIQMA
jgi:N-methylhydantoinase A